jgi:hypothetical protein
MSPAQAPGGAFYWHPASRAGALYGVNPTSTISLVTSACVSLRNHHRAPPVPPMGLTPRQPCFGNVCLRAPYAQGGGAAVSQL